MARCSSTKTHWDRAAGAFARLDAINANPDPSRAYQPTGVVKCACGRYVLTSRDGKPGSRGKSRRSRRVQRRK